MAISAKDVMALRKQTGLGMMECKAALTEVDGDMDAAAELVRKKFGAKMAGRADRENTEGKVCVSVSDDGTTGAIVQVNTETDFTANTVAFQAMAQNIADLGLLQGPGEISKTDDMERAIEATRITTQENIQFAKGQVVGGEGQKVGHYVHFTGKVGVVVAVEGEASDELLKDLCMHVSAVSPAPLAINPEDVPADLIEKEKAFAKQEAIDSGKPDEIAEKMVTGKMRKFTEELSLTKQKFVKDEKQKIEDLLPDGTTIKAFARYSIG